MSFKKPARDLIELLSHSLWIRLVLGLISAIAAYLEFQSAGLTWLFGVLCALVLIIVLLTVIQWSWRLFQKWQAQRLREAALHYDHQRKLETLSTLVEEFGTFEKAKRLEETLSIEGNIRILVILLIEGMPGVILNVGKDNNVQVGTPLLVYRTDEYTSEGNHIESLLGLVEVTYVQAGNNCSQAVVTGEYDRDYWNEVLAQLEQRRRVTPPSNFAVPYIPRELTNLSAEDLGVFCTYLGNIHDSLTRTQQEQQHQEDS